MGGKDVNTAATGNTSVHEKEYDKENPETPLDFQLDYHAVISKKEQTEYQTEFQKKVRDHINKYATPNYTTPLFMLANTFALYFGIHYLVYNKYVPWYIMVWLMTLLKSRMYIIFHDCGHLSLFPDKLTNQFFGHLLGAFVFTPYNYWLHGHNRHHLSNNNMSRNLVAQSVPLTVEQFKELSFGGKVYHTLIYGPVTFYLLTPILGYLLLNRFYTTPMEYLFTFPYIIYIAWLGSMDILLLEFFSWYFHFIWDFFLFHAQHTFDGVFRERQDKWTWFDAAMYGSSNLVIPKPLQYFTVAIQYHHIHHMNTRVPCYNIPACHWEGKELFKDVPTFGLDYAITTIFYFLYDEKKKKFISLYEYLTKY